MQRRSASTDVITLETPNMQPNVAQAILYIDEATGYSQWILPAVQTGSTTTRGSGGVLFQLPRDTERAPRRSGNRGPITQAIRKIVRHIVWETDELLADGIVQFVRKRELKRHHYGWQYLPWTKRDPIDWQAFRNKRSLILLHGTFSTAEAAFTGLGTDGIYALQPIYQDRIIAFNHPTMSDSPQANVAKLLEELPPNGDYDILAHSRGGLVGRELLGHGVHVNKLIMVATPNQGTRLADGERWLDMIDRYTTLVVKAPDSMSTVIIEGILTLVKVIVHAGVNALDGLAAMRPNNSYLRDLNSRPRPSTQLYALGADYQPTDPLWIKRWCHMVGDKLVDSFFDEPNDGVVPIAGTYWLDAQTNWLIPDSQRFCFASEKGISHTTFFQHPDVQRQIVTWLNEA